MRREDLLLYAITDRRWLGEDSLADQVEKAIRGGATMVQLREKDMSYPDMKAEALDIQKVCRKYNIPYIINDNIKLALDIDADGVHVGQGDMPVDEVRSLLGPDKIIGVTAKTPEQARKAKDLGADYLGSGAIFGSTTKNDAKNMTISMFNSICDSVDIPVVAIGGITFDNMDELADSKMAGVALVSAIFAAKDIERTTEKIKEKLWSFKR